MIEKIDDELMKEIEQSEQNDRKNRRDRTAKDIANAAIVGATVDTVSRYGTANKQYLNAYSSIDNAPQKPGFKPKLNKHSNLKSIETMKINPKDADRNVKQQAGFSAEVLSVADSNAESAAKGEKIRRGRTDDHGSVNDEHYDTMEYDAYGNPITGTGTQLKFIGGTPKETLSKLASKKNEKHIESDAKIEIPSDKYDEVVRLADEKVNSIKKQLQDPKVANDPETFAAKKKELEKYTKLKKKLHKSSVSTEEAEYARKYPELATAQRIAKYSHKAGVEGAKYGAAIGGTVSMVKNIVSLLNEEVELKNAVANVTADTTESAAMGYATASVGSAISGVMQNATEENVRAIAKTAVPGAMAQIALASGKTVKRWINGEIDGTECFKELGQEGTNIVSGSTFAVLGQIAIPIPVIGGLIGCMAGYTLSSLFYSTLNVSLQNAKFVGEERVRIEIECAEQLKMIYVFKTEMQRIINNYLAEIKFTFGRALQEMDKAREINDVNAYTQCANNIIRTLGGTPLYDNFKEFDALMRGSEPIVL